MNNCDVFILISILIVVLLLIYNRNKRDKQIEGFFFNPLGGGGGWADSVRDDIKVKGMPSNLGVQKVIFDIANEDGDNNINTKDMEYDKVREKLQDLAWNKIITARPYAKIQAESRKQIVGLLGASGDETWPRGFPPGVENDQWSTVDNRNTDFENKKGDVQARIKELAQQAVRNGANGVHDKIKELARAEFDKKFSELQGAAIQLNKSGIRCTKNGSSVSCPDSIVQSG
jgi:hypothetical protein